MLGRLPALRMPQSSAKGAALNPFCRGDQCYETGSVFFIKVNTRHLKESTIYNV